MAGFRVRVEHTIDQLERDMVRITRNAKPKLSKVVRKNTLAGRKLAQVNARAASGPHGIHYWKRITDEMIDPLTGEYGPHGQVTGVAVGAAYRHISRGPNTDLEKSLDIIGPKFRSDVDDVIDSLFWSG